MNETTPGTPVGATTEPTQTNTTPAPSSAPQGDTLLASTGNPENKPVNPEGEAQTAEAAKSSEVPEKYEFKAIDGLEINSGLLDEFTPIAKELGLSNEKAQKLVDFQAKIMLEQQKAYSDAWTNTLDKWASETKADKEIGGEALEGSVNAARNVVDKYGDDGLKNLIDPPSASNPGGLGLGNNAAFIRALARIGKAMGEDQTNLKAQTAQEPADRAKRLFPGMS